MADLSHQACQRLHTPLRFKRAIDGDRSDPFLQGRDTRPRQARVQFELRHDCGEAGYCNVVNMPPVRHRLWRQDQARGEPGSLFRAHVNYGGQPRRCAGSRVGRFLNGRTQRAGEAPVGLKNVIPVLADLLPDAVQVAEDVLLDQVAKVPRRLIFLTVLDRDNFDAAVPGQNNIITGPLDHHCGDLATWQKVRDAPQHNASVLVLKSRPGLPRRVPRVAGQAPLKPWETSHSAEHNVRMRCHKAIPARAADG